MYANFTKRGGSKLPYVFHTIANYLRIENFSGNILFEQPSMRFTKVDHDVCPYVRMYECMDVRMFSNDKKHIPKKN